MKRFNSVKLNLLIHITRVVALVSAELHHSELEEDCSAWQKMQYVWKNMTKWGQWMPHSGPKRQHVRSSKTWLCLHNSSASQSYTHFYFPNPIQWSWDASQAPELCSFTMTRTGNKSGVPRLHAVASGKLAGLKSLCENQAETGTLFYHEASLIAFIIIYFWLPTTSEHVLGKSYLLDLYNSLEEKAALSSFEFVMVEHPRIDSWHFVMDKFLQMPPKKQGRPIRQ